MKAREEKTIASYYGTRPKTTAGVTSVDYENKAVEISTQSFLDAI
jgi:hypothetical protein